jgi:hypothetical protein
MIFGYDTLCYQKSITWMGMTTSEYPMQGSQTKINKFDVNVD